MQFKIMKEKMREAIGKLRAINVRSATAYIFYNTYLCIKVCFRCRIMSITEKQEQELMKIHKPIILRKISLSEKFLRCMLHIRKSALRVGLIKPSIMIAILALKLYLGNKKLQNSIEHVITINERIAFF